MRIGVATTAGSMAEWRLFFEFKVKRRYNCVTSDDVSKPGIRRDKAGLEYTHSAYIGRFVHVLLREEKEHG